VTGQGIDNLLQETVHQLHEQDKIPQAPIMMPSMKAPEDLSWEVELNGDVFEVHGKRIQRMVAMTNMKNDEALRYLHRRLERLGVINRLRDLGAEQGDTVKIGELEFAFSEER
jgi:GTP-binding protein